ncbi:peptidoglycan DD-metalloendopeptidase family protein [Clostridium sp.]|uniref:peptidoglycan DD-metalloendopeptidase family protein n=1 Tax=Clostridium sp. TaxID=1506 RepID=UPI002907D6E0|nr:peptidoglycan DD-metalloendopeptidase family protein [Clostridium sp.]MDU5107421.1 peptidoglycan DD-metalloendopeptidase family protein [Clostridium sp.]
MDIKGKSVRLKKIFIKVALLIIIINIILNGSYLKVNAEVNDNLNINLNNKVYSGVNEVSDNIFDNLMVALTGKINAYEVMLNDKIIGYTVSENNLESVKNIILKKYIDENSIKEDMVKEFDIKGDIILREERLEVDLIQTNEEIANNIYELSKRESNNIKINIKYLKEEVNNIKPSTMTIPTETLYLGESKIEEGIYGLKKDTKEYIVEAGKIINSKLIKEDIIKEAVSKKIYRGTKNPYEYGVAFLNHPTRGGYMTSGYGERWSSFHKGIDIAGNIGDNVFAAMDGEITYAEYNDGGYGNLIIIKHEDNMSTYYGHLSEYKVKVGDKVKKGDIIGEVGNTGFSTGPHLHFELRVNNEPVDPTGYIVQ